MIIVVPLKYINMIKELKVVLIKYINVQTNLKIVMIHLNLKIVMIHLNYYSLILMIMIILCPVNLINNSV